MIRELEWKPLGEEPRREARSFRRMVSGWQWLEPKDNGCASIALKGGAAATIMAFPDSQPSGASWASNDVIYFVSSTPGGIVRVSGQGGDPVEVCHRFRQWRADLTNATRASGGGSRVRSRDERIRVIRRCVDRGVYTGDRTAQSAGRGRLLPALFAVRPHRVRARWTLFAVPSMRIARGHRSAVRRVEGVMMSRNTGVANYDISANGELLHRRQGGWWRANIALGGSSGRVEKLPLPPRSYLHPRISPDGRRLAIEIEGSRHDVFVYDFASGVLTNFTVDGISHWPIWSPDGKRIGYRSGPMGRFKLFQMPADRSGRAGATGNAGDVGEHRVVRSDGTRDGLHRHRPTDDRRKSW